MDKKPISAKIPENLYNEIQKSGKSTTDCVIDGLELLFSISENPQQEPERNTAEIQAIIEEKERLIESLEGTNKFLQSELIRSNNRYDRLLGSPPEVRPKKWWEIWK